MAEGLTAWVFVLLLIVAPWLVIVASAATALNLVLVVAMMVVFSLGVLLLTATVLET